jgi:acyl-homoserine lactone synthase
MIQALSGQSRAYNPRLFQQLFKLRHKVFVGGRKWSLPTQGDMEIDQYDVPEAVYFWRQDDDGQVDCHVRITPTTKHSLLADYFPHLVEGDTSPRGKTIYEATRYIAMPSKKTRENNRTAKAELLLQMLEWADANGVTHIQTVIDTATYASFVEMTPDTRPLGLSFPYGGGPTVSGGGECMAIRWPVNEKVMQDLRKYGGIDCEQCGKCSKVDSPFAA